MFTALIGGLALGGITCSGGQSNEEWKLPELLEHLDELAAIRHAVPFGTALITTEEVLGRDSPEFEPLRGEYCYAWLGNKRRWSAFQEIPSATDASVREVFSVHQRFDGVSTYSLERDGTDSGIASDPQYHPIVGPRFDPVWIGASFDDLGDIESAADLLRSFPADAVMIEPRSDGHPGVVVSAESDLEMLHLELRWDHQGLADRLRHEVKGERSLDLTVQSFAEGVVPYAKEGKVSFQFRIGAPDGVISGTWSFTLDLETASPFDRSDLSGFVIAPRFDFERAEWIAEKVATAPAPRLPASSARNIESFDLISFGFGCVCFLTAFALLRGEHRRRTYSGSLNRSLIP